MTDDRNAALPDPPAANQGKDEPIATTPGESPQSSDGPTSDAHSDDQTAPGDGTMPAAATGGVPVPGDSQGVSVPSVQAAAGTSEESEQVDSVRITSIAPPGKPDGEVDTRS